jgi:DNA-binding MarR family transcriptional regulator
LLDTGPLEPHEIGELCRLSSPSLAGVLSRMENIGFVQRKRLADDQRRVRVSLTPRSRALASRMAPLIEAVYAHIEDLLGKEFAENFYRVLDDLIVKLRQ